MTEAQVLEIIEKISNKLCHKFKFGFYTAEDIKQQAFILGWNALDRYDGVRPLENFLWSHIKNRLCNFKRDNFERKDSPCLKCPFKAYNTNVPSQCDLHIDKMQCDLYKKWSSRNSPKKNIMNTMDIENVSDETESNMSTLNDMESNMDMTAIFDKIDKELPIYLRPHYIKWKAGCKIPKIYRDEIKSIIKGIAGVLYE